MEANRRYEFTVEYRKDDDGQSYDGEGAMIFLVGAPHTYHTIPDKYIIQGQWYKTTHYVTLSETKTISVQYRVNSREYHVRDVRIRDTSEGIAEDILIDGSSIGNLDKAKQEYTVELPYGFTEFPSLAAVLNPSYQDACYLISQQPSKQNMKAQLKIIDSENGWSDEYNIYFKEKEPYTIHEPIFVDIGNRTQVSIQIDNNALVPMEEKSFAMIVGSYNDDSTNLNMAYVYNTQISAQGSVKLMTEIESLSQNIYCFMVDSIENIRPMMLPVRK